MPPLPERDLSNFSIHQTELGNVSIGNIAEITCPPLCPMARLPPLTGIYASGCPVHDIPPNFVVGDGLDFWTGIAQTPDGTTIIVVGETSTTEPTVLLPLAPRGTIITLSVHSLAIPPESPHLSSSLGSLPPPPPPSPVLSGRQSDSLTASPDLSSFALASPTPSGPRGHPRVDASCTITRDFVRESPTPLGIVPPIGQANLLRTPETPTPRHAGSPRLLDCMTPSDTGDEGDDDGAVRRGIPCPLSSLAPPHQDSDDDSLDYDLIRWAHIHSTEYEVFTAEEAIGNYEAQSTDWDNRGSLALDEHRLNELQLSEVLEQHAMTMHNLGMCNGRLHFPSEFQSSYRTRMD
ncbi:hypothetical protein BJ912DRAFT_933218 [Pholiota molesta]|nr:hypothetical protein BJ912DRAFT_933218 [Pholiota molesta]